MIPMSVRLSNEQVDRHITRNISDFSYRLGTPGGFISAQFQLHRPITVKDPLLEAFTRVYVYGANGNVLWEGRIALPGKGADADGQVWSITAAGGAAHASDVKRSLIYCDRDLTSLVKNNSSPQGEGSIDEDPGDSANESAMVFRFPNAVTTNTNSNVAYTYDRIAQAQMLIGGISYDFDMGFTAGADFHVQAVCQPGAVVVDDLANTAGGSHIGLSAGGTLDVGHTTVTFRWIRVSGGALVIAGDATWASVANMVIRGQLVTKAGAAITGAGTYANRYVFAHEVIADLLGRSMLPMYDGANAKIATTFVQIDQLAYADPVSAQEVLSDLMTLEAGYYWAAWESNPLLGDQYRFEWSPWPITARYDATVADGINSPSPTFELYNEAMVKWKDPLGRTRLGPVTLALPLLDNIGLTRTGVLDISDETGSAANAISAGTAFLSDHNRTPSAGTLTVSRPIRDIKNGCLTQPWEIKPGELIRVHGIEASIDLGQAGNADGLTTFRIVGVEVRSDGTATLELDMFTRDEARALAELLRRRRRKLW